MRNIKRRINHQSNLCFIDLTLEKESRNKSVICVLEAIITYTHISWK